MSDLKKLPYVTVEQVLRLRKAALSRIAELEAKVQELEQQISDLQAAACKYIKIEADMENFDGDKRGMMEHFTEAKTKLTALLPLPPHRGE